MAKKAEFLKDFDLKESNFTLDKNYLIRDIPQHKDVVIKVSFDDDKILVLIQEWARDPSNRRYEFESQKNVEFKETTNNKLNQFKNYVNVYYEKINNLNIFSNSLKLDAAAEEAFQIYQKRFKKPNLMHLDLNFEVDSFLLSVLDNSFTELCRPRA